MSIRRGVLSILVGGIAGAAVATTALRDFSVPQRADVPDLSMDPPVVAAEAPASALEADDNTVSVQGLVDPLQAALALNADEADADALAALESLLASGSRDDDQLAWDRIALAAVAADPFDALAVAESSNDERAHRQLLALWAALEPEAVFAWLDSVEHVRHVQSQVAEQLARYDAERLLQFAQTLTEDSRQRSEAVGAVARAMIEQDLSYAAAFAAGMAPGRERESMLSSVAARYISEYPDAAWSWVKSLDPPPGDSVMQTLVLNLAEDDPLRAVDILLDPDAPWGGLPRQMMMSMTVSNLMGPLNSDPALVVEKLFATSTEDARILARSALSSWAASSPGDASRWVRNSLTRANAEVIVEVAASQVASSDPDAAVDLVLLLRGQPRFQLVLNQVLTRVQNESDYSRISAELATMGITVGPRP